jgi:hypothetical protein
MKCVRHSTPPRTPFPPASPSGLPPRAASPSAARRPRRPYAARLAVPGISAGHADPSFDERETPMHRIGEWMRRLGLIWAVVALAGGLVGIYEWQQQKRVDELVDLDSAMLLDDLPPAAYADQGFHVFLKHGE